MGRAAASGLTNNKPHTSSINENSDYYNENYEYGRVLSHELSYHTIPDPISLLHDEIGTSNECPNETNSIRETSTQDDEASIEEFRDQLAREELIHGNRLTKSFRIQPLPLSQLLPASDLQQDEFVENIPEQERYLSSVFHHEVNELEENEVVQSLRRSQRISEKRERALTSANLVVGDVARGNLKRRKRSKKPKKFRNKATQTDEEEILANSKNLFSLFESNSE